MEEKADLDQPFICCGVCFAENNNNLLLTSCAHITCKQHLTESTGYRNEKYLSCPICNARNISIVKIDSQLPSELKNFFIPFPQQIDLIASSSKFQYCGLIERLNNYKRLNSRLLEKVNKQKQLLYAAKDELNQLNDYKIKVKQLTRELQTLKQGNSRPETIDLTDFSDEVEFTHMKTPSKTPSESTNGASNTFIEKIHKQSSQKVIPGSAPKQKKHANELGMISPAISSGRRSFFAESTKIGEYSKPPSASSRSSPSNVALTPRRINTGISPMPSNGHSRIAKKRSATTQLDSKVSSHLKVGGLETGAHLLQLRSTNSDSPFIYQRR